LKAKALLATPLKPFQMFYSRCFAGALTKKTVLINISFANAESDPEAPTERARQLPGQNGVITNIMLILLLTVHTTMLKLVCKKPC